MPSVSFTVPGKAIGKGRPRFSRKSGTAYTPTETRNYEAYVRYLAAEAMKKAGLEPFDKPCALIVHVYCTVPQSWPKKKLNAAFLGELCPGKPDLDNMVKGLGDAMNGVVFKDDSLIRILDARKSWGVVATTEVTVSC